MVTGVSSSGGKKGTFFVQGDDASDNAAIPVYCKEDCNVSVTNLSDLEGNVVTVSGTGVMGLYGCGLQLVHTSSKPVAITVVTDTVNVTPKTLKIADIGVNTPSTPYAGMLLKVEGAKLSSDSKYLTQGTDQIEPSGYIYKHTWTAGATYSSVTGVLHYVKTGYLASRRASDIVEATPCVGECKNNMYYACIDGVLSTSGTGQPTTANGSYTCDVNKGWVLSCDTGYKPNTSNDGCVEASSGGASYSTDFSFITGGNTTQKQNYTTSYTYTDTSFGYEVSANCRADMGNYSIDGQGCILRTDKNSGSMIVVSKISGGIDTVSLDAKGWDAGSISITVGETVYGPQSVSKDSQSALEFAIQNATATSFTVTSVKRIAVDNLEWTTMH